MSYGKVNATRTALAHVAILMVAVVLIYARVLHGSFVFDDRNRIAENEAIRITSNIPSMFLFPSGHLASRPLELATLALNYRIGELDTFGYHLLNIALHALAGILLVPARSSHRASHSA